MTFEELRCLKEDGPVNVFMLDHDPESAAKAHVDRHVIKMIVESAQLLSSAWHCLSNDYWDPLPDDEADDPPETITPWVRQVVYAPGRPQPRLKSASGEVFFAHWELFGQRIYTKTHADHPAATWVRSLGGNYRWLWRLAVALCDEYKYRYGRAHATLPVLWTLEAPPPPLVESLESWTEVPPVVPEECRVEQGGYYDTVASYRMYYADKKRDLHAWTKRGPPIWL